MKPTLIVVEDYRDTLEGVMRYGSAAGFNVVGCSDGNAGLEAIETALHDGSLCAVVTDLKMPGKNSDDVWGGWQVLAHAYRQSQSLDLAVYTSYGGSEVNEVFRSGAALPAFTLFEKPRDRRKLKAWLKEKATNWSSRFSLTLHDKDTKRIYEEMAPVYARSDLPLLVLGETGTGKELLARQVHNLSGRRGPFVAVNCGGLEPNLAFSELFGHTKTAYTGALAHEIGLFMTASGYTEPPSSADEGFEEWFRRGNSDLELVSGVFQSNVAKENAGTLFLDEVGALPRKVMAGLLRALSTYDIHPLGYSGGGVRTYCRIVAATNEYSILKRGLEGGDEFRSDLYHRLGGAVLNLAPLKDRDPADIIQYVKSTAWGQIDLPHMSVDKIALEKVVDLYQRRSDSAAVEFQSGNFRSLRNLVHRAALISRHEGAASVSAQHMDLAIEHGHLSLRSPQILTDSQHIRATFREWLIAREIELEVDFTIEELKGVTASFPIEVGGAFLQCATLGRINNGKDRRKGVYLIREIEMALARGVGRSSWYTKELTKSHIRDAAVRYFVSDLPDDCVDTNAIIKHIITHRKGSR